MKMKGKIEIKLSQEGMKEIVRNYFHDTILQGEIKEIRTEGYPIDFVVVFGEAEEANG
jgi:hypothetical protein